MRTRTRVILLLVIAAAIALFVWCRHAAPVATGAHGHGQGSHAQGAHGHGAHGHGAGGAVPVLVTQALRQDVPVTLDAIGTVQAYNTVQIKPMVDGPLVEIRFQEGQDIKAGDILARIDPRPYQATLDQYLGKKAQDEAQLANARLDLARYKKLAATAYTSAQTADTQRATVSADEALVQQDQAQIASARVQLGYTTIRSPIDGRTGLRQVDIGNIVHASDATPLTVVTQLHPIYVVFTVPQQDLPAVTAAMQADATRAAQPPVQAFAQGVPLGTAAPLDTGTLSVIDNQIDSATGTVKLKASFPNPHQTLWPGGFVGVRLTTAVLHGAITVPPAALQRGPDSVYVYTIAKDGTAHRQTVTLGPQTETAAVVTSGLNAGASVVTDGASRLTDGGKVRLPKARPPRPAAGGSATP